ncbi:uncharacterized protein KRP23_278 [Phytophthora ramorum]|uniref:uncharacterized protein n=1 Tax=Phytophthora ramorum TaxID=164328 RepID=UPI0030A8B8AD|nr:hypothetical protein KRP23_278 [Phytophthora ramorum]
MRSYYFVLLVSAYLTAYSESALTPVQPFASDVNVPVPYNSVQGGGSNKRFLRTENKKPIVAADEAHTVPNTDADTLISSNTEERAPYWFIKKLDELLRSGKTMAQPPLDRQNAKRFDVFVNSKLERQPAKKFGDIVKQKLGRQNAKRFDDFVISKLERQNAKKFDNLFKPKLERQNAKKFGDIVKLKFERQNAKKFKGYTAQ